MSFFRYLAVKLNLQILFIFLALGLASGCGMAWFNTAPIDPYFIAVLNDKPLGYWRLDDSNTTLVDFSGHNATGSYSGTLGTQYRQNQPSLIPSTSDTAAYFNLGFANIPFGIAPNPGNTMSIELWLKGDPASGTWAPVALNCDGAISNGWTLTRHNNTGNLHFSLGTSAGANQSFLIAGGWDGNAHYVVITVSGGTVYAYIDSALITTFPFLVGAGFASTLNGLTIGGVQGGNSQEYVDDVAIYGYPLSQAQISTHYQWGLHR